MQKFASNVQDKNGRAVGGASVTVLDSVGNPAAIFIGNNSSAQTNPIVTDVDGEYAFYAANGRYSITISAPGFIGESVSDVLLYDPAEPYSPIDSTIANSAASAFASAQEAAASASAAESNKNQTAIDRAATGADRAQTSIDRSATAADCAQTNSDKTATGNDRAAVAADRAQADLAAAATAADRAQTSTDRATAVASAATATSKASEAATSASNAATSEANALSSKNASATSAANAATSEASALASKNAAATSATSAANSAASIDAPTLLTKLDSIEQKLESAISITDAPFNADPSSPNNTAAVQAAIDCAIERGIAEIEVPQGSFAVPGALTNRSNVVFVGDGHLTGAGAYRTRVVPEQADGPTPFSNIVPKSHLNKFLTATNPVVVVVGDSIFTPQPNTLDQSNTPWAVLIDKIQRDNPGKSIAFHNRAVGGMTWAEINGTAWTNFPDWYTNTGRAWLEYVKDLNPDLVIFASGMNDAHLNGFNPAHVTDVVAKVKAWTKVPDMLFVTTPVPTLEPGPGFEMYATKADQEGRDKNAGWIRSYADYNGYGYLDVNRQFNMARDGRDILNTQAERVATDVALPTGSYVAAAEHECRDFSLRIALPSTAFNGPKTLAVSLGSNVNDTVLLFASGGKIRFDFYYLAGAAVVNYKNVVSDIALPATAFEMQVEKKGNVFIASFSHDTRTAAVVRQKIIAPGDVFTPKVGWYDDQFATGPGTSLKWLNIGKERRIKPTITNDEMWGVGDASAGTKLPYGGNGINHPTSLGVSAVFEPVIRNSLFAAQGTVYFDAVSGYEISSSGQIRQWGGLVHGSPVAGAKITWPIAFPTACRGVQMTIGIPVADLAGGGVATSQSLVNVGIPSLVDVSYSTFHLTDPANGRIVYWESYGR